MKKFYITTSIAYTNAPPHIGFALELIQADLVARYNRSIGHSVMFLTGTDEHGLKIARKAKDLGKDPKEFCDEISSRFRKLTQELNVSNDDFIRTTDKEKHWPGVLKFWKTMESSGDIYEKDYQGLYCVGCETFIREKDLVDGKCPYHKTEPEKIREKNHFFKLSKYSKKIMDIIENNEIEIIPHNRKNELIHFIEKGLEDVSFSRPKEKIGWGIPVPGDESKLIYVWGDALVNYVSAIGYGRDESSFNDYWPADVHFIGKDISKFHALIWPGMLLSAKLPLPKKIFIHGFLTIDGQKMSKSLGNIVDPFDLIDRYGSDPVRYFFLREMNPTEDGDFSQEKFRDRYNADLADGLGNLVARVFSMALKSQIKLSDSIKIRPSFIKEIEKTSEKKNELMSEFKFNSALEEIWKLISFADKYIERNRPWERREGSDLIIKELIYLIYSIGEMIEPFMPKTSAKIFNQISQGKRDNLFEKI